MTPFSAPGAAAAPPRPQGPPAAAGVPRQVMGSYGNNLAAAVRVAPSQTPRVQSTAIARPRVPFAPHAQGPPIAGAPRPMVHPGGAPMSAPSPTLRMQPVPQPARAPGIPPNARAVGAAVPPARPHMPLSQPTQRTPAAANPAAPSLGKRPPTRPAPVPAAKRHAPIPRPQGAAPTGGAPLPAGAPSPSQHAPAGNAAPSRPPPTQQLPNLSYIGVYRDPSKGWMARAMDLKRRVARSIGPFDDPHLAALAHDRAAIACAGRGVARGAPLNFEAAFYRVETAFLHRWEGDVCDALEKGEYEKVYARFLRAGYKAALNIEDGDDGDGDAHADELVASCVGDAQFFWDDVEDFFLCRAAEIGEEALKGKEDGRDDGGKLLRDRFVEMHRNKSLCPEWRHKNRLEKLRMMTLQKQQQIQTQQQQQQQIQQRQQQVQMQQQQPQQIQTQQQRQQQIHVQHQQQQQIQMKPGQQQQIQQQRQIQMQQQQRQQQIQQRQQQFQHQMMMQNQQQQQMMMAQQQQQYLDDDATVQVKQELS